MHSGRTSTASGQLRVANWVLRFANRTPFKVTDLPVLAIVLATIPLCTFTADFQNELAVTVELGVAAYLFGRIKLPTELICMAIWTVVLACLFLVPAAGQYFSDESDWRTLWNQGMFLLATIPVAASLVVGAIRTWLEPALCRATPSRIFDSEKQSRSL